MAAEAPTGRAAHATKPPAEHDLPRRPGDSASIDGVGVVYLAALVVGLGTILVQLMMSGDADGDADADAHADVGDGDADAAGDHEMGHDVGHAGADVLMVVLSLRFWTFALLAFGLSGALLHYLELASRVVTPVVAIVLGLASGLVASWVFRALVSSETSSGALADDAVGQVGKVLVPPSQGSRGKVRIVLKGQAVDVLATTDESDLTVGDQVLVEEMEDATAHVSRAPAAFLPPRSED